MNLIRGHWQLIAIVTAVFLLWNTSVVLPLKILVVFMHELAHGLAAVATGGSIEGISLSPQQGGHALTRGGNGFVILSAGYVGSLLIGAALLLIALRTNTDRLVMGLCGAAMLWVTAFYIRDTFPFFFCGITGVAMLGVSWLLSRPVNDLILRVIGLTSLIYAPYDIFSDTIARSNLQSDAFMIAERYGGSTMFWGGLWLVMSAGVIVLCLRYGIGASSNLEFRFWGDD